MTSLTNTRVGYDRVLYQGVRPARSRVTHTARGARVYGAPAAARLAERVSKKESEAAAFSSVSASACFTPHHTNQALGYGSAAKGGAPSTADGHLIAFGNTLESSIKTVLGLKQIGTDGERPYDRCSGQGFVAACDGDYADALRKKRSVVLFLTESSGAVESRGVRLFARLSKDVRRKGAVDGTVYGTAATSTRSFFVHHLSAVAAGAIRADALTLENTAAALTFFDTHSTNRAVGAA